LVCLPSSLRIKTYAPLSFCAVFFLVEMKNLWSMKMVVQQLADDVRLKEGMNACMNCGICTAVCPAAEYFEYDPRSIVVAVQSGNEEKIQQLLTSDTIWMCGQCMSCKTRCPRSNCPGIIINVLRKVSQATGAFVQSRLGRQQYLIMKTIGANLLRYGYCIHPSAVDIQNHPEQGPVWEWVYSNREEVYERLGANLDREGPGAMRKIATNDLLELAVIFEQSGGTVLWQSIETHSKNKAIELGLVDSQGNPCMDLYTNYLLNEDPEF